FAEHELGWIGRGAHPVGEVDLGARVGGLGGAFSERRGLHAAAGSPRARCIEAVAPRRQTSGAWWRPRRARARGRCGPSTISPLLRGDLALPPLDRSC